MTASATSNTQDIRRHMRRARRALTRDLQQSHARQAALHFARSRLPLHASTVAGYVAADGELDLQDVFSRLFSMGKRVALPVIDPLTRRLEFFEHLPHAPLVAGRYGIPVPPPEARHIPTLAIDLVLTPLVAFDGTGSRVGMGGGYYDRTFGRLNRHLRPTLIGAAHSLQEAPSHLKRQPWDVAIDGVLTECGFARFSKRKFGTNKE